MDDMSGFFERPDRHLRIHRGKTVEQGACNACIERPEEILVIELRGCSVRVCHNCACRLMAELRNLGVRPGDLTE